MTPSRIHYRNLPQLFLKAREELMCHFRPIINHHGLTEQQWRIMRVLSERDQLEPWEICDICQILSPSLAGVLARMDDMGVITRSRVPEDQRRVLVRLSPQGEALVEQMAPLIEAQYKLIEESLGTELLQDVYRVLDRVVNEERPPIKRVELPGASPAQADAAPKRRARRKSA
ncbi:MAG: homoprotocatechuate degradation operon regulator HpaR [Zoogloea sp.]|uniref:homoprotocatechuate degradation operon regulator HpaR n=1 Tax=Zoogloea sp. TaxID=49181 RepID=UPI003F2B9703